MNISNVGSQAPISHPASADKRAQLQMLLLKKSLEIQQAETAAVTRQLEGKGQTIDIRV